MIEVIITGTLLGAVYALSAIGFTLLFGVAKVLNLAHGAIMVLAAYVSWFVTTNLGVNAVSIALSVVLACLAALIAAQIINYFVVKPTARRTGIGAHKREGIVLATTLLAAVVIEEFVTHVFTPQPIITALTVPGQTEILGTTILNSRIFIGVLAAVILLAVWYFLRYTRMGAAVTASAISKRGVSISGVNLRRVEAIVWVAYGFLVGLAGVLTASFIGVDGGSALGLTVTAFAIVCLGGLGSIPGSAIAALFLGLAETATLFMISPQLSGLPALLVMIIVLIVRPTGIFGQKVSAA